MRGIAGQQHPSGAVGRDLPALAAVSRRPGHVPRPEILAGDASQRGPDVIHCHGLGDRRLGARVVVQHDPAGAIAKGEHQQHPGTRKVAVGRSHRQAVQEKVGENDRARIGKAREWQLQRLAHGAADAVTGNGISGPLRSAVSRADPHAMLVLRDPGDRARPADLGSELERSRHEQPLDLTLRHIEEVRKIGVEPAEIYPRPARPERESRHGQSGLGEPLGLAAQVEHLHASGMQADRAGIGPRAVPPLQDQARHARQRQLGREQQPGWSRAHDEHAVVARLCHLSSLPRKPFDTRSSR